VIGQKDGHAWALDPDKQGAVVWSRQVGLGLDGGGGAIMWGSAADDRCGYFPVTRQRAARPRGVTVATARSPGARRRPTAARRR
jgi:hypothetical protein